MKEQFLALFGSWINQYKTDIQSKVENFLEENESNPEELAEIIDVDVDEIYDILEGHGEDISVETFGKLLLASGFALAIEPIEQTPLRTYDNVNPHVMRQPQREERREPRQNPFVQPPVPHGMGRNFPPRDFDPSRIPPHVREEMEREFERRHPMGDIRGIPPFNPRSEAPQSPFETMDDERMKRIIRHELWDSEINLNTASHRDLVKFLTEKDKRKQEIARRDKQEKEVEELERDPQVTDFVKRMKKNIKDNPQFRSYMKNFLNNLDEE
jgi:hypothetical protein